MKNQVLILTTEISPRDRDMIEAKLSDLKPDSVTAREIEHRLRQMIDRGCVQVFDRDVLLDNDLHKIKTMVDAGQRGLIVVEGVQPASDDLVPAKTLRRRARLRARAQAAGGGRHV